MDEYDETFFLNLSNATNATIISNSSVITIADNDEAPVLTINDRTKTEGDNGMMALTYTHSTSDFERFVSAQKPVQ